MEQINEQINEQSILQTYDYNIIKTKLWENPNYYNAVKIILLSCFYVKEKNNYISFNEKSLKLSYRHIKVEIEENGKKKKKNFIDMWIDDEYIHKKIDVINIPPQHLEKLKSKNKKYDDMFNLWENYYITNVKLINYKQEVVDIFIEYIDKLFNNKKHSEFMLNWISHLFKYPEQKTRVMPIIIDKYNYGKDSLLILLNKLIGFRHMYKTSKPQNDVLGQFNAVLDQYKLIQFSEGCLKLTENNINILKNIMTSDIIEIKSKGQNKKQINSYNNFIFLSNNILPISIFIKDDMKRFLLLYVSLTLKNNEKYFDDFYNMLNDEQNLRSIYEYLINRKETPYFFNETNIPINDFVEYEDFYYNKFLNEKF